MALHSAAKSSIAIVVSYTKSLNDASKLCFGAAVGCFVVGTMGWVVNSLEPETTMLHGLLVVAAFYFALGVIKLFEKQAGDSGRSGQNLGTEGQLLVPNKNLETKEKPFKSAA